MHVDRTGVGLALAAYGLWGIAPVYFKWLTFAGPVEVVAHRVLWSVLVLVLLVGLRGRWHVVRSLTGRQLAWLAVSGAPHLGQLAALCVGRHQ
jgi:chloramphenicol-sensitive protein RarD